MEKGRLFPVRAQTVEASIDVSEQQAKTPKNIQVVLLDE
jgi:hypothetical protein